MAIGYSSDSVLFGMDMCKEWLSSFYFVGHIILWQMVLRDDCLVLQLILSDDCLILQCITQSQLLRVRLCVHFGLLY